MPDTHGAAQVPPVTAAEITDEIWLEVARRHAEGGPSRALVQQAAPTPPPAMLAPVPLQALLALDGTAFIEAAYATVLGRPADEVGLAHLSAELAHGREKTELLANLQNSPEGQQAGRFIDGLRPPEAGRRLSRIPVLRQAVRVGRAAIRRSVLARAPLPGTVPVLAARMEAPPQLAALEAGLESWRRAMEGQLIDHRLAVDIVTRRLATVQAAHEELGRKTLKAMTDQATLLARLSERSATFARQLAATEDSVIDSLLALEDSIAKQEARLVAVEAIAAQNARDVAEQQRRIEAWLASPQPGSTG